MNTQGRNQHKQFLGDRKRESSSGTNVRVHKLYFCLQFLGAGGGGLSLIHSVDASYFCFYPHQGCSRTMGADSYLMLRCLFDHIYQNNICASNKLGVKGRCQKFSL